MGAGLTPGRGFWCSGHDDTVAASPTPRAGLARSTLTAVPTVTIDAQAATWLVAHALGELDGWPEPEDEDGCCPTCCGPCGALKLLLDAGQLDDIARPYGQDGLSWWDDANDRVDRGWLERGWRMTACHEQD